MNNNKNKELNFNSLHFLESFKIMSNLYDMYSNERDCCEGELDFEILERLYFYLLNLESIILHK